MNNVPVYPIVDMRLGAMSELNSIVMWIQYQTKAVHDVDDLIESPILMLDVDKTKALIAELKKHLEKLEW